MLSSRLQSLGHVTKIREGDADTLIVSMAMDSAAGGQAAVAVVEDTDIFVMLLYHYCDRSNDGFASNDGLTTVFLKKEAKRPRQRQVYSIKEAAEVVPAQIWKRVLVIHAWSSCDFTSATFGQGKTTLLKTMAKSKEVQDLSNIVGGRGTSQAMRVLAYSVVCIV